MKKIVYYIIVYVKHNVIVLTRIPQAAMEGNLSFLITITINDIDYAHTVLIKFSKLVCLIAIYKIKRKRITTTYLIFNII